MYLSVKETSISLRLTSIGTKASICNFPGGSIGSQTAAECSFVSCISASAPPEESEFWEKFVSVCWKHEDLDTTFLPICWQVWFQSNVFEAECWTILLYNFSQLCMSEQIFTMKTQQLSSKIICKKWFVKCQQLILIRFENQTVSWPKDLRGVQ